MRSCITPHRGKPKPPASSFSILIADHIVVCSISPSGNVSDNAAVESFFSSSKTRANSAQNILERRDEAKADVFDYI